MESNPIIELDVMGKPFKARLSTLKKSEMLKNMLEDSSVDLTKPLYLETSSIVFEFVLGYLANDQFPFPKKYIYELDFYLIPYTVHDRDSDVITKLPQLYCSMNKCTNRNVYGEPYCKEHRKSYCTLSTCQRETTYGSQCCAEHECAHILCRNVVQQTSEPGRYTKYCSVHDIKILLDDQTDSRYYDRSRRKPNESFANSIALQAYIKKQLPNETLNNVGAMAKVIWPLLKENNNNLEQAKKAFEPVTFMRAYNAAKKQQAVNKSAKV